MTRAKRIVLSSEVKEYIAGYRSVLRCSPYQCDKRTISRKVKSMKSAIRQRARNPLSLPDCTDEELGYAKNQDGTPKFPCFKSILYTDPKSNAQWKFSVIYDASTGTSTIYRMMGVEGIHESRWIPIQDFNKQIKKENTMNKLNITKKQYSESKYLQKKYGKLEYVSESGKVFKTSKGHLIKLLQESDEDDDRLWVLITIEDDDSTNVDVFNRKESVREHLIDSDNFDDEDIDEIMTNGKGDVGWCRVELWHCPIED